MVTKRIFLGDTEETLLLCGEQDSNLKILEKRLGVQIFARSSALAVRGNPRKVDEAIAALEELRTQIRTRPRGTEGTEQRDPLYSKRAAAHSKNIKLLYPKQESPPDSSADKHSRSLGQKLSLQDDAICSTVTGKKIRPHSPQQTKYVQALSSYDMVMAVGPAGTGKTFLAVVCALNALQAGRVQRIVLTRPVVEAGEKLGFLPGDLYEKVNPYLRPLYDAFYTLLGSERFRIYKEDETIEIVPLAYMRGRTLENSFVILDEAQNTTPQQMKMFLTRMGQNSKMVITGDITQIDLETKKESGFVQSLRILKHIPEIQCIQFSEADIVRHSLVRKILHAYEISEGKTGSP